MARFYLYERAELDGPSDAPSHYYTIGASDNNADRGGRCNTGWRDDDNNRVDSDSNSRWNNSRWNSLALRK